MASRSRVAWTQEGRRTLEEVVSYLSGDSPAAARQILSEALQAASSLSTLSGRGRVVPELGDPAIRELFVHRYRLMYQTTDQGVFVLAFIHGARDFAKWRRESEP